MYCKFIFHLPSAGSMSLIIILIFFAVPHGRPFLSFVTIHSVPLPQYTDSRGSALEPALLSFTISSWSFLPFHAACVYYITVLHLTWVYKTVQDYLLPFLFCSQGIAGTETGSNQWSYLLAAVKGQAQDIHLAVWRPIKMSSLILTWLLTSVTSAERKKNATSTL